MARHLQDGGTSDPSTQQFRPPGQGLGTGLGTQLGPLQAVLLTGPLAPVCPGLGQEAFPRPLLCELICELMTWW